MTAPRYQNRFGWAGPYAALKAWESDALRAEFIPFAITGHTPRTESRTRFAPWDNAIQKATGKKHLRKYAQLVGSCVSHGAKNAVENLACVEIAEKGEAEEFHDIYSPWYYLIGRCAPEGGNGQMGNQDGSLGSWMAATIKIYGTLYYDDPGLPEYSAATEKLFGRDKSLIGKYKATAADNLVRGVARLRSADEVMNAILQGYMVTCASMWGAGMKAKKQYGKHWCWQNRDRWPHQMSCIAVCKGTDCPHGVSHPPLIFRENSWGADTHAPADSDEVDGPGSGAWQTAEDVENDVSKGDSEYFAFSDQQGWPAKEMVWDNTAPVF